MLKSPSISIKGSQTIRNSINHIWQSRLFIWTASKQRIKQRYIGTWFGPLWLVLQPALFLTAMGFVRVVIFGSSWTAPDGTALANEQSILLMGVGLFTFWVFAEPVSSSTSLYRQFSGTLLSTPIRLETLSCILLTETAVNLLVRIIMLAVCMAAFYQPVWSGMLLVPLVFLPLALFTLAITTLLALCGVLARDFDLVVPPMTTALLFLSAVFYPVYALPESYQQLFLFNPIAVTIGALRDLVFWHRLPDFYLLGALTLFSILLLHFSWTLTNRLRGKVIDAV